jgi:DNA-binding protein HU-beta
MTKTELIAFIADRAELSKSSAKRAVNAMEEAVTETLQKDGEVTMKGFGKFSVFKRAGRTGHNPRTGVKLKIPSTNVPKFTPGQALKDAVN